MLDIIAMITWLVVMCFFEGMILIKIDYKRKVVEENILKAEDELNVQKS